jgi:hypothetical protein
MGLRTATLTATRTFAGLINTSIRTAITAVSINPTQTGGLYLGPFNIPQDMDTTRPSDLTWRITRVSGTTNTLTVVNWHLILTRCPIGATPADHAWDYETSVPIDWPLNDAVEFTFDNGSGHTFDPGAFAPTDLVGIRIEKPIGDPSDRFPNSINLPLAFRFTYSTKFPWLPVQI